MFRLENDQLAVDILDPLADEARLGTRYCSGGYIYQVSDHRVGPLCSGPAYPAPVPPVFDGQGLPEAFPPTLLAREGHTLVLGVGVVESGAKGGVERCPWQVEQTAGQMAMGTSQSFAGWALALQKTVTLDGRTLSSQIRLTNQGDKALPYSWFAHPFFPLRDDGACCRFSFPVGFLPNPGFRVNQEGFVEMARDYPWQKGHFQWIQGVGGQTLHAVQRHPILEQLQVIGDFPITKMPIWGNANTVSFEPYYVRTLAAGQEAAWSITYTW